MTFWLVVFVWLGCYPLLLGGPQWMPMLEVHWLAAAAAALAVAPRVWLRRAQAPWPPVLATLITLVSLAIALSVNRDDFPRDELRWSADTGLAHGLFFVAVLFAVPTRDAHPLRQATARRMLLLTLLAVALGQGALVLLDPQRADPTWRPAGTLVNPNALGAVAGACALAVAALGRWRAWAWAVGLALVVLMLVTGSRGAAVSFGAVLMVLTWRRFGLAALLLAVGAAALLVLVPNPLWGRVVALQSEHVFSRPFLWGTALENIAAHPLGIGPGMNKYVFPMHAFDPDRHWLLHQRHSVGLTHNVLLTLALEWGWLALGAGLGLVAWAAGKLWPKHDDNLGQAATLGAAVLFVELQVDALEQHPIVFSLFLLLAATAMARLPRRPSGGPACTGPWPAVIGLLVAMTLVSATTRHHEEVTVVAELDAALAAYTALAAIAEPGAAAAPAALNSMREVLSRAQGSGPLARRRWLDFEESVLRRRIAAEAPQDELVAHLGLVRSLMDGARRADPRDVELARQCAGILLLAHRSLEREGGVNQADTPLLEAYFEAMAALLAIDPLDVEARLRLALEAQAADRTVLRDEQMQELLRLEPDYAWAWLVRARHHEVDGRLEQALYAWVRAREAVLNCRIHAKADNPRSRRFYLRNLDWVRLSVVQQRIVTLRRELYD